MKKGRKILAAVLAAALAIGIIPGNCFAEYETTKFLAGDADGSGKVDVDDALAILKFTVEIEQSVFNEKAGDADGNGKVDVDDALIVLKYMAEIIKVIPAGCTEHTFDEGTVLKLATLKEEGLIQYTCTLCGTTKQEMLPILEECTEHMWDDGEFVDAYFSEPQKWANGYIGYNPGWQLEIIPSFITDPSARDIIRQFIVFSDQIDDYDSKNEVTTRYCEEGLKEYTCRICGEKKTDFCVKKRSVPVEADSVKWDWHFDPDDVANSGYQPTTSGWTGKYCWLEDEELTNSSYFKQIGLSEEIYSKEQEEALDTISAQFVSGNMGLYEYEAAVREYLSDLNIFDTSETKGELLIGCNVWFRDDMQHWGPYLDYFRWIKLPNGASTDAQLSNHPFQYVYLNAYSDREENHSVSFTISLYVENPLLEK